MFFYNILPKFPLVGFYALEYEINIQTPQSNIFKITLTAANKVHVISDVYTGDKAKQDASLAYCIDYLYKQISQKIDSLDLSKMITKLESIKELPIASQDVETARSKKLRTLIKNKEIKDEQRKSNKSSDN